MQCHYSHRQHNEIWKNSLLHIIYITPFIVARAGYFSMISFTGMAVVKISFLRIWYVASIRAFIFPLSWLAICLEFSLPNSTKCSLWIASVVPSKDGTTFQKSSLLDFLVFGYSGTVSSGLVLDWQKSDNLRFLFSYFLTYLKWFLIASFQDPWKHK